ncbi:DUF1656 domain-containing protein [Algiphilus sp. W345]|uniref:DUF1656 domain-containing protein n=1 Tax=Banduia mediterranea TaxID=3075609 RepID=A0ABU2WGG3_9GAMM|nr:DUF1656 domain-containing protein [Algiphilus sp. W345]MDT0496724.1 DUF1656 domain-containing protein [Algiphilus sp. W345]
MPRELELFGIVFPTLIPLLLLAGGLSWLLDGALARSGFFRNVWHPSLFRISVTVLMFSVFGLLLFSR